MLLLAQSAHHISPALANFLGWAVVIAVIAALLGFLIKILKGG